MLIGESNEVDALLTEELRKHPQGLVCVLTSESEGAGPVLRARPIRQLGPYHPIPLAIDAWMSTWHGDVLTPVDYYAHVSRPRHQREFEGGESSF